MPVGYMARNQACFIPSVLVGLHGPGHSCTSANALSKGRGGGQVLLPCLGARSADQPSCRVCRRGQRASLRPPEANKTGIVTVASVGQADTCWAPRCHLTVSRTAVSLALYSGENRLRNRVLGPQPQTAHSCSGPQWTQTGHGPPGLRVLTSKPGKPLQL